MIIPELTETRIKQFQKRGNYIWQNFITISVTKKKKTFASLTNLDRERYLPERGKIPSSDDRPERTDISAATAAFCQRRKAGKWETKDKTFLRWHQLAVLTSAGKSLTANNQTHSCL